MSRFEFRKNAVELDIAGQVFSVEVTSDLLRRVSAFGQAASAKAETVKEAADGAALDEAVDFVMDAIDSILGAGAADRIFDGRDENLMDCVDVMAYIVEEVSAFFSTRGVPAIPAAVTLNRAQRRRMRE